MYLDHKYNRGYREILIEFRLINLGTYNTSLLVEQWRFIRNIMLLYGSVSYFIIL